MATSLFSLSFSNRIQRLVMEREEDEVPFLPPLENLSNVHVHQLPPTVSSWKESLARGGDPRLAHLPFMESSLPITLVLVSYILFVKVIGPRIMRNREPLELKRVLLIYNGLMILLSTSQFIRGGVYGWFPFMKKTYNYACQPVDYSYSREGMGMALTAYIYFLSKIVELLDTVFFVLRKKDSHVTTLHVSHHALVAYLMYWGVKYFPGGHGSFQGFANSFVHMVMYTYYFLSAMGVRVWWKRYLTLIQMTQFVLILLHGMQILARPECDYPKVITYPYIAVVVYLLIMFVNFYRKAYNKARVERRKRRQEEAIRAAEVDSANSRTEVIPQCLLLSVHDRMRATTSKQSINVKEENNNTTTVLHPHLDSVVQVRQRMRDQVEEEEKSDSKRVM